MGGAASAPVTPGPRRIVRRSCSSSGGSASRGSIDRDRCGGASRAASGIRRRRPGCDNGRTPGGRCGSTSGNAAGGGGDGGGSTSVAPSQSQSSPRPPVPHLVQWCQPPMLSPDSDRNPGPAGSVELAAAREKERGETPATSEDTELAAAVDRARKPLLEVFATGKTAPIGERVALSYDAVQQGFSRAMRTNARWLDKPVTMGLSWSWTRREWSHFNNGERASTIRTRTQLWGWCGAVREAWCCGRRRCWHGAVARRRWCGCTTSALAPGGLSRRHACQARGHGVHARNRGMCRCSNLSIAAHESVCARARVRVCVCTHVLVVRC